jgi:hypothetical protein
MPITSVTCGRTAESRRRGRSRARRTKLNTWIGEQGTADNRGDKGAAGAGTVHGRSAIGALIHYIGSATRSAASVWCKQSLRTLWDRVGDEGEHPARGPWVRMGRG